MLSFAIYSMPGTSHFLQISGPALPIARDEIFQHDGFVFAPFDLASEPVYVINGSVENCDLEALDDYQWEMGKRQVEKTSRPTYTAMFDQALSAIQSGFLEKIVISARDIDQQGILSVSQFVTRLRQSYPNAFVYVFYMPGVEMWIGATPEMLLEVSDTTRSTVALAGTMRNVAKLTDWGEKERLEHRFVEQFVEETLDGRHYRKTGPAPIQAGPVYHLKTEYQIPLDEPFVNPVDLHPGPALSGYPVPESVERIKQIEHEPRRYYTGFLGPVSTSGKCRMYINLRCLEVLQTGSVLYAGGGLTIDSDLEKEWREIQDKLSTLRSKMYKDHNKV